MMHARDDSECLPCPALPGVLLSFSHSLCATLLGALLCPDPQSAH